MRIIHLGGAFLTLVCATRQVAAQSQPTIPVVVAQANSFGPEMFGVTQYFDGRLPPGWPTDLVPPGAKVLGGSAQSESSPFQMHTAVFAFSGQANPNEVIRSLIIAAGYVRHDLESSRGIGGFVGSEPSTAHNYCKGDSMVNFKAVDSVQAPLVMAIHMVDGETARQNCAPQPDWMQGQRFPVTVPTLTPPKGVVTFGGGSSWSGDEGTIRSTLRTTLSPDSILANYTTQLVAAGWKAEGRPALGEGIAVQRFSVQSGKDPWTAAVIVVALGEKRDVRLELMRGDAR